MNDEVSQASDGPGRGGLPSAGALVVADPERVAFDLWNEGRVDEAVAYLENQIAEARRKRREGREPSSDRPAGLTGWDATLEPVSSWRERHRSALAASDFNAYGASAPTIDVTPTRADAITPARRRGGRRAWVMGITLAMLGVAAGSLYFAGSRDAGPSAETLLAALGDAPEANDGGAAPVAADPQTVAEESTPSDEVAEDAEAVADLLPAGVVEDVPPPEAGASGSGWDALGPESTASIGPPADKEAEKLAPVTEARLPRLRPEPPAGLRPEPQQAADAEPNVVGPPPPEPPPVYAEADATGYGLPYPRATLTPAEYQALLERRAWATQYAAERRAYAERRAEFVPILVPAPVYRAP